MVIYLSAFAVPLHLYLLLKIRACFGWRWATWGWVAWTLFFLLAPSSIYFGYLPEGRMTEILFAVSITEYVTAGMACIIFAGLDILRIALWLWDKAAGTGREKALTPCRVLATGAVLVICGFMYCYWEAWNVRRVEIAIPTAKLPSGVQRLRIVNIVDVHLGGIYPPRRLKRLMAMVRAENPDLFVVTGDLVDGNMRGRDSEAMWLAEHGAKYGAFAVDGNHEFAAGRDQALDFMERAGLHVLHDTFAEAAGIVVVGLDSAGGDEFWPLEPLPDGRFVLLLKHYPQVVPRSRGKFDLQLSGHTHGGQIWPFIYSMTRAYGHVQGLSKQGESFVYVSNGAGFWAAPLRFLTPPEMTVLDLVPLP